MASVRLSCGINSSEGKPEAMEDSLIPYLERQAEWSNRTFGPGLRTNGILEHIRKELKEIEAKPGDLEEWIDVIILALDGYWRHYGHPLDLMRHLQDKQNKNFARRWPEPTDEDIVVEHLRLNPWDTR